MIRDLVYRIQTAAEMVEDFGDGVTEADVAELSCDDVLDLITRAAEASGLLAMTAANLAGILTARANAIMDAVVAM